MIITWYIILKLATDGNSEPPKRVEKAEEEWKNVLTEEEFYVTRKHGTERPGSGAFCSAFDPGIYACKCCKTLQCHQIHSRQLTFSRARRNPLQCM